MRDENTSTAFLGVGHDHPACRRGNAGKELKIPEVARRYASRLRNSIWERKTLRFEYERIMDLLSGHRNLSYSTPNK